MDELRSWLGRTTTTSVHLDSARANLMAGTLDLPTCKVTGDDLPPGWHWLYLHDVVPGSKLGPDGHPALGVTMPPVPLTRRMWASGSLKFSGALRLGDDVVWSRTITDITAKKGRSGPLYFVTVEQVLDVDGDRRLTEQQNIVYRDLDLGPTSASPRPAAPIDAAYSRAWPLNEVTLFRYSALTFNSHRIHYDADYARDAEGYPDLVVHGPLLATLLMDLAQDRGGALASFSYRARSPLFRSDGLATHGRSSAAGADLWAASADGRLAMDATATYYQTEK